MCGEKVKKKTRELQAALWRLCLFDVPVAKFWASRTLKQRATNVSRVTLLDGDLLSWVLLLRLRSSKMLVEAFSNSSFLLQIVRFTFLSSLPVLFIVFFISDYGYRLFLTLEEGRLVDGYFEMTIRPLMNSRWELGIVLPTALAFHSLGRLRSLLAASFAFILSSYATCVTAVTLHEMLHEALDRVSE